MSDRTCVGVDCDRPIMVKAKQMCFKHYQRFMKTGSTELPPKPPRICVAEDCDRELIGSTGRGMCAMHYRRFKVYGTADKPPKVCKVEGCERTWIAQEMCAMHYQRFVKTGTTDPSDHPNVGGRVYRPPAPAEPRPSKPVVNAGYCKVEGCDKRPKTAGICAMHATRLRRGEHAATMCRWCWEVFTPTLRGNRVFCSDDCYLAHRADYARSHTRQWLIDNPKPPVPRFPTPCEYCGVVFEADKRRSRYCTDECRAVDKNRANWKHLNARRARLRDAFVESFDRREIFERDGWVCGLCHDLIDKDLPWPHPMSASLDHIVPISRDGEHSRANAQASHFVCNIRKGNRMVA